jgi:hypothetical protein
MVLTLECSMLVVKEKHCKLQITCLGFKVFLNIGIFFLVYMGLNLEMCVHYLMCRLYILCAIIVLTPTISNSSTKFVILTFKLKFLKKLFCIFL